MTATVNCPICLNHFPIGGDKPEFLMFPCGHGFCASCTNRLFPTLSLERTARCPNCRKFINQRDGHPVYLEIVDSDPIEKQKKEIEALQAELNQSHHDIDCLTSALGELKACNQEVKRERNRFKDMLDLHAAISRLQEERKIKLLKDIVAMK